MDQHYSDETETTGEGRSIAALIVIMALAFGAYCALRIAIPELPLVWALPVNPHYSL